MFHFSIVHVYYNYRALGGADNLRIPSFGSATHLGNYVLNVKELLDNKVSCYAWKLKQSYSVEFVYYSLSYKK